MEQGSTLASQHLEWESREMCDLGDVPEGFCSETWTQGMPAWEESWDSVQERLCTHQVGKGIVGKKKGLSKGPKVRKCTRHVPSHK